MAAGTAAAIVDRGDDARGAGFDYARTQKKDRKLPQSAEPARSRDEDHRARQRSRGRHRADRRRPRARSGHHRQDLAHRQLADVRAPAQDREPQASADGHRLERHDLARAVVLAAEVLASVRSSRRPRLSALLAPCAARRDGEPRARPRHRHQGRRGAVPRVSHPGHRRHGARSRRARALRGPRSGARAPGGADRARAGASRRRPRRGQRLAAREVAIPRADSAGRCREPRSRPARQAERQRRVRALRRTSRA